MATLGAYAYNAWPLLLDLTDGAVRHLIVIRNGELLYWDNLTPQQAYYKQSEILSSSEILKDRKLKMSAIPEDLQQPLKQLRKLQGDSESGLLQQLNDVVPDLPSEERFAASYDIISSWAHLQPITLLPAVRTFCKMTLKGSRELSCLCQLNIQATLDCILYLMQYPYDPGIIPSSAN